jgi:hypothetical protein
MPPGVYWGDDRRGRVLSLTINVDMQTMILVSVVALTSLALGYCGSRLARRDGNQV